VPAPIVSYMPAPTASYASAPATRYVPAPIINYAPAPITTYAPAPVAAYALALGTTTMPSVQSKLTPHFLGDIEQPIEDFLEEYERLADRYGLTGPRRWRQSFGTSTAPSTISGNICQDSSITTGTHSTMSFVKNMSPPPPKASSQDRS
jgi:hypothetical protein